MSIYEFPSRRQAQLAQDVFDAIEASGATYYNPINRSQVAAITGLSLAEVSEGIFWLHRTLAETNQTHVGTHHGPGGGYWICADEDEVEMSLVSRAGERYNRSLVDLGKVKASASLTNPTTQMLRVHEAEDALFRARMELVQLGADPGDITA